LEKTHGDPQRRKHQGDSTSKQASGTTSAPSHQESGPSLTLPTVELPTGTTQATTAAHSVEDLQRTLLTTPHQTAPIVEPNRDRGPNVETDILALEEDAPELTLSNFVSQNYKTLATLMQEEARRRSSQSLQARLNFGPEYEASPSRYRKEGREKDSRRLPVFARVGRKVVDGEASDSQYSEEHEDDRRRTNVHARLGSSRIQDKFGRQRSPSESPSRSSSIRVHDRLGRQHSPSESLPSSDSEEKRRKRRKRDNSSSSDSSDNEDKETGHWKSRRRHRDEEDEDISLPWRRQKVDAFTRRISDYSKDNRRRMPANVKTYDGTSDPDDHL
jgi:hypothetical protein